MGRAICYLLVALFLGYFALVGREEAFWRDLAPPKIQQNPGPILTIVYLIRAAALFVHDTLGTSLMMWLLGIAAFLAAVCCIHAVATAKKN